jgi:predicted Zn-dependent peptidase
MLMSSTVALGRLASTQEIPFTRFELPNGLKVILHEDHRLPLVCVNLWYYVGSKDEPPRRSGFAHLFEHLMFMGTEKTPYGVFDSTIEKGGGSNNASTSTDRTNYFEWGPRELLETFLRLEADRMAGLGAAMTQEKLDTQRGVVRNERRQNYENRPYGKMQLEIPQRIFPPEHPYHNPVIGSHEDLERASVDDVKDFFARYYFARNASLVVAGDFDPAEARSLVEKHFGPLPSRPPLERPTPAAPRLDRVLKDNLVDDVELALSAFVWHSPAMFAAGDSELDLLASILGGGKSGRLYKRLVYEKKLAQNVSVFQASRHLASEFRILAYARPGVSQDELEAEADKVVDELLHDGPTQREVDRARNGIEAAFWHEIESLRERADLLNRYQFHLDDPGGLARDLERYRNATVEGVSEWARKVLRRDARLVLRVVPRKSAGDATAPSDGSPPAQAKPQAVKDAPRRPEFQLPEPEVFRLSNGLEVWSLTAEGLPLAALRLVLRFGAADDPPGKEGLAALTAAMLDEGTESRSALEIAEEIDFLGAHLSISTAKDYSEVALGALERNLEPALAVFADVVSQPSFEEREWSRVKNLWLNDLLQRREDPRAVARVVTERVFYGDGHPYGHPESGWEASARAVSLGDVRTAHERRVDPRSCVLIAATRLGRREIEPLLEKHLGSWIPERPGGVKPPERPPVPPPASSPRLVLVDKPGAPQTEVRVVVPAPSIGEAELAPLALANLIFGGSFTSRLNSNLREDKRITYGANSAAARRRGPAALVAASAVQGGKTDLALVELCREFQRMATGEVSADELEKVRSLYKRRLVEAMESQDGLVGLFVEAAAHGQSPGEVRRFHESVLAASVEDIAAAARARWCWERGSVVLVGDLKALREQLAALETTKPEVAAGRRFSLPVAEVRNREGATAP